MLIVVERILCFTFLYPFYSPVDDKEITVIISEQKSMSEVFQASDSRQQALLLLAFHQEKSIHNFEYLFKTDDGLYVFKEVYEDTIQYYVDVEKGSVFLMNISNY